MAKSVLHTSLCDELNIEYPIFLAGMGVKGRATPPELVAAVSDAGGMGILGCSWLDHNEVRRRIRAVRNLTDKPFGVDLLLPASMAEGVPDRAEMRARIERDFPQHVAFVKELHKKFGLQPLSDNKAAMSGEFIRRQVDVCIEEKIAVFAAGLGDPSWVVPMAHQVGMKVMGLVGNVRNAERQKKAGVDYVIAQGYEAGGHTGAALHPQLTAATDESLHGFRGGSHPVFPGSALAGHQHSGQGNLQPANGQPINPSVLTPA